MTALDPLERVPRSIRTRVDAVRFDPRQPFQVRGTALQSGGEERARLVGSFEDALTGIALSDVLDGRDLDMLLGPWADLDPAGPAAR